MSSEKRKFWLFCYDVTNIMRRFLPDRERSTLQTSCGTERVNYVYAREHIKIHRLGATGIDSIINKNQYNYKAEEGIHIIL